MLHSHVAGAEKLVMLIHKGSCEELCISFKKGLQKLGTVRFVSPDARANTLHKDTDTLVSEARRSRPDLVVTFGPEITLAVVGSHNAVDKSRYLTDIPVFYILNDPVAAGIQSSEGQSGRDNLAGVKIMSSESEHVAMMRSYRKIQRIAILHSPASDYAVQQAARMRQALQLKNIEVTDFAITFAPDAIIDNRQAEKLLQKITLSAPDFIYYLASKNHIAAVAQAAMSRGIPIFNPLAGNYPKGSILLNLDISLASLGSYAAQQAGKILFQHKLSGHLGISTNKPIAIVVDMEAARILKIYPPMKLLQIAVIRN